MLKTAMYVHLQLLFAKYNNYFNYICNYFKFQSDCCDFHGQHTLLQLVVANAKKENQAIS